MWVRVQSGSLLPEYLQMRTGLNYARLTEYFEWLLSHGFLQRGEEEGTEMYSLSPQGLDLYHRLVAWIRETMEGMRI
jgi:predicted transcriptional regulator